MARRKRRKAEHVNHERWLVSYADFITLLFAFFVVLFAISQVDAAKMGRFTEAVQAATNRGFFDSAEGARVVGPVLEEEGRARAPSPAAPIEPPSMEVIRERLAGALASAIDEGRIALVEVEDGLVVRLREAAFFESASAHLRDEMRADLSAVGQTLRDIDNHVRIEGHTDPIPIRNSSYRSNWELSAARAASVLSWFAAESGISERRMSIAGFADQRPVADNRTPEGRKQNRRVDIVVLHLNPRTRAPR